MSSYYSAIIIKTMNKWWYVHYIFSKEILWPQPEQILVHMSVSAQYVSSVKECSWAPVEDCRMLDRTALLNSETVTHTDSSCIYSINIYGMAWNTYWWEYIWRIHYFLIFFFPRLVDYNLADQSQSSTSHANIRTHITGGIQFGGSLTHLPICQIKFSANISCHILNYKQWRIV